MFRRMCSRSWLASCAADSCGAAAASAPLLVVVATASLLSGGSSAASTAMELGFSSSRTPTNLNCLPLGALSRSDSQSLYLHGSSGSTQWGNKLTARVRACLRCKAFAMCTTSNATRGRLHQATVHVQSIERCTLCPAGLQVVGPATYGTAQQGCLCLHLCQAQAPLLAAAHLSSSSRLAAAASRASSLDSPGSAVTWRYLDPSRPRQSARRPASVPSMGPHKRDTTGKTCSEVGRGAV